MQESWDVRSSSSLRRASRCLRLPLIGHHQLTALLLRAKLLSPDARIVIASSEAARGDVPFFSYTDLPAFAAKYYQGDRTAAVEALLRSGPNVKYQPNRAFADAKLIAAWWAAALARRLPTGMAVYRRLAWCHAQHQCGAKRWLAHEVAVDSADETHPRNVSHS